jgi:LPXTG-motif cell wall-anchored protein
VIQIGDGANPTVTVTNTYQGVGGFSLRKAIDGVDASDIPSGAEFDVVGWTRIDGEFAWRGFRLPADGSPVDGPDDLPTGTVVRFLEIDPPPIEGYTFESVSFAPDALIVGTGDSPVMTATNTYAAMVGGFTVQKEVDGDATGDVPADASFTVAYFVDGATEPSGLLGLPVDGTPIAGPSDLPVGAVVTFEEIGPLPEVPGASWGAPSITPAEVVIGDAENAVVTVTNVITADVGGFRIRKEVSGSAASLVPSETIFAVEYYLDGAAEPSGLLELPASGGFVDGPQDLRVGTVVTFAEITPMPIVPGVEWSDPGAFSPEAVVISAEEQSSVVLTNVAEAADDLPATGGSPPWQALLLALLLVAAGSALASRRRAYR